jgi:diguanylate cyclase (GGDEF)-like protein
MKPSGNRPAWRRLHVRIVGLFLALLLLVQLVSFVAIRESIESRADRQIANDLRTSEAVLRQLLNQDTQKLAEGARLLAADFGFRTAVASADKATVLDALDNQASRIGASVALFTDRQHRLVASTLPDSTKLLDLVRANLVSRPEDPDHQVEILEGRPYQLITVPVRAPQLIGHVSMGFPLTARLAQDLASLSSVRLALLSKTRGQAGWQALSVGETGRDLGTTVLTGSEAVVTLKLAQELYRGRIVPLAIDDTHEASALLMRSVDEVIGPYRNLQLTLLLITFGGVAVMTAGSLIMAQRVTVPLKQLTKSAERLGEGDFTTPVSGSGADEVGDLARSFEAMRLAVQAREDQIRRLAYWDSLTGLPNRAQFCETVDALLAKASSHRESCAILLLDLDRFKLINDVLGSVFGDRVLQQIAIRLSEGLLREVDILARLSGDEFAFCLPGLSATQATEVAQRIRLALDRPLTLEDQTVDVAGSVGMAFCPVHGQSTELLLNRAEVAMYAAKNRRMGVLAYDPGMDISSGYSLSLLTDLRTAVDSGQLQVYLQPKVRLADGQVIGAEALLRWQHPERGLIPPSQFVPFAEQSGFVRVLTTWMIEHTAQHAKELGALWPTFKFAVNLSARDLMDQDFASKVQGLASGSGMNLERLTLEITESSMMEDPERSLQNLQRLRQLGVKLSVDDFGTGYSSLAYLKRLPLDELKIDRSFVMQMQANAADVSIVRSTIDLAHNLGLSVVAEGIESAGVFRQLQQLGCDEGQGYRIARPMPAADFRAWVYQWQAPNSETRPGELHAA